VLQNKRIDFGYSDFLIFGTQMDKIIEIVIIFYELIKVNPVMLSMFFYDFYGLIF